MSLYTVCWTSTRNLFYCTMGQEIEWRTTCGTSGILTDSSGIFVLFPICAPTTKHHSLRLDLKAARLRNNDPGTKFTFIFKRRTCIMEHLHAKKCTDSVTYSCQIRLAVSPHPLLANTLSAWGFQSLVAASRLGYNRLFVTRTFNEENSTSHYNITYRVTKPRICTCTLFVSFAGSDGNSRIRPKFGGSACNANQM